MTLPSSGQLTLNDINIELGRSSGTEISLDSAENGSYATINPYSCKKPSSTNPASVSEWRGYDHNATIDKTRYIFARLESTLNSGSWGIYYGSTAIVTGIGVNATTCVQRGAGVVFNDGQTVTFYVKNNNGVNVAFYGNTSTISGTCPTGGTMTDAFSVTFDACTLWVGITVRVSAGSFVVL